MGTGKAKGGMYGGMRVCIRKILKKEDEKVIIECMEITPEVEDIRAYAAGKGAEIWGTTDSRRTERFRLEDVYYFEALDEKLFAYTGEQVYEVKMRLYEAERAFERFHFVRCSKSVILNLLLLEGISPALNGRFFAHMKNGERLMISRQYAGEMKRIVMGGGNDEK